MDGGARPRDVEPANSSVRAVFGALCLVQTSNEARPVDRLFTTGHIGVWARHHSSVVAGGKDKRNAPRCQYVGDRIHALVSEIDVEHGTVETPPLIFDQRQRLLNRASR